MQPLRYAAELEPERGWWPPDPDETAYGSPVPAHGYQRWPLMCCGNVEIYDSIARDMSSNPIGKEMGLYHQW